MAKYFKKRCRQKFALFINFHFFTLLHKKAGKLRRACPSKPLPAFFFSLFTFYFLLFTSAFGAEWEAADKFTVDGRTLLRSTVTIVSQSSQTYILGLQNPAGNFAVFITTAGRVGVGTTSPGSLLDVAGGIKLGTAAVCDAGSEGTLRYGSGSFEICINNSWNTLSSTAVWSGSGGNLFLEGGNIAIGTNTANERLTVDGFISLKTYDAGTAPSATGGYGKIFAIGGVGGNDSYIKLLLHCDGTDGATVFTDSETTAPKNVTNSEHYDSYTKLMLHMEGSGNTFVDSETPAKTVTPHGSVTQTTAQYKFGSKSAALNGSTDSLTIPDSNDWFFGTGDWTIDCWIRTISTAQQFIAGQDPNGNTDFWWTLISNGDLLFSFHLGGNYIGYYSTSDHPISTNAWHHVAFVRNGDTPLIFVDGVPKTLTVGQNWGVNPNLPNYGGNLEIGFQSQNGLFFNGNMDELRISQGIARWTTAFNPPAAPYGQVVTATAQKKFGAASGLFSGGSYLSVDDSADWFFGTAPFTIDSWVKFSSFAGIQGIYSQATSLGMNEITFYWSPNSFTFFIYDNTSGGYQLIFTAPFTPALDAWNHVALVRVDGGNADTSWGVFVNGNRLTLTKVLGNWNANCLDIAAVANIGIGHFGAGGFPLNGGIDELRISKGIARWTSNFTVPSGPYDFGGSLWFKDNSGNVFTLAGSTGPAPSSIWGQNGSDIYYTSGKVGIGTASPAAKLSVSGDALFTSTVTVSTITFSDGTILYSTRTLGSGSGDISSASTQTFTGQNTFSNLTTFSSTAYISGSAGIGTNTPSNKLDVVGTAEINGQAVISGTATILGNAFSVGASTFAITGGSVGIGTTNPGLKMQVDINTSNSIVGPKGVLIRNTDSNLGDTVGVRFAHRDSLGTGGITSILANVANYSTDLAFNNTDSTGNTYERMRISNSGNVGIGTTGPNNFLEINKSQNSETAITILNANAGTAAQSSLIFGSATSGGTYGYLTYYGSGFSANGLLQARRTMLFGGDTGGLSLIAYNGPLIFATGGFAAGNERMRIDNTGNVGIGSTAPAAMLDVSGNTISADGIWTMEAGGELTTAAGNDLNLDVPATRSLFIKLAGAPKISMDNTGSVGIGSVNPVTKLDIIGNGRNFPASSGTTQSSGHVARLHDNTSLVLDIGGYGSYGFWLQSADATNLAVNYPILLNPNGGNVGIGTTAPNGKLQIYDSVDNWLQGTITNSSNGTSAVARIGAGNPGSSLYIEKLGAGYSGTGAREAGYGALFDSSSAGLNLAAGGAGAVMRFYTGGGMASNERMRIDSSGNVGIGTTSPGGFLEIGSPLADSQGKILRFTSGGTEWLKLTRLDASSTALLQSAANVVLQPAGGNVGIGTTNPGNPLSVYRNQNGATYFSITNPNTGTGAYSGFTIGQTEGSGTSFGGIQYFNSNYAASGYYRPNTTLVAGYSSGGLTLAGGYNGNGGDMRFFTNTTETGTERMRIDNGGNVGIGTTGPIRLLTVGNTVIGSSEISMLSGSSGFSSLLFGDGLSAPDPYRGYIQYQHNGDYLLLGTASSERIRITSDGSVGIGTTNPLSSLHLYNPALSAITIDAPAANQSRVVWAKDGVNKWILYSPNSSNDLQLYDSAARVTFQSGGNVGIGTIVPLDRLHIQQTKSAGLYGLYVDDTTSQTLGVGGAILFRGAYSGTTLTPAAHIEAYKEDSTAGGYNYSLVFGTRGMGDGLSYPKEKMRITSGGNVGVGTTGPAADAKLEVAGGDTTGFRLQPRSTSGAPSTGTWSKGTLIIDSGGVLYICTSGGTPGTWAKVGAQ